MRTRGTWQPSDEQPTLSATNGADRRRCTQCSDLIPPHTLIEWHGPEVDLYLHPSCVQELTIMLCNEILRVRLRAQRRHGTTLA